MKEAFKRDGVYDSSKIGMGLAFAIVIVLQQWQTYRIAEISARSKANHYNFMSIEEVRKCKDKINSRLTKLEQIIINKGK